MESLRTYLNSLEKPAQDDFASRSGTSVGYLRKAISTKERIAAETAIALDLESGGEVAVEEVRPDIDWVALRDSLASRSNTRRRRA